MLLFHIAPHASFEVFQLLRRGDTFRKDRSVNILRRVSAGLANNNRIALLIPLQNRTWPEYEFFAAPHDGNGNLTLSRNL